MKTPLHHRIIVSTRPVEQAFQLQQQVTARGGILVHFPMIQTKARELTMDELVLMDQLKEFQWVSFSSAEGVRYFFDRCQALQVPRNTLQQIHFTAIGEATAQKIEHYGYSPRYIDPAGNGSSYGNALNQLIPAKDQVLLVKGVLAGDQLSEQFTHGQMVQRINVYNTIAPAEWDHHTVERLAAGQYDLLFFASPSGFHNFSSLFRSTLQMNLLKIAAIGPTTAKAIEEQGLRVALACSGPTVPDVVQSFESYFSHAKNHLP